MNAATARLSLYLRFALVMLAISVPCRIVFLLLFNRESGALSFGNIGLSLIHGFRFDAAAFAMVFFLPIILFSLPIRWRIYSRLTWFVALFLFFFVFAITLGDIIFYSISHRRSAAEMFAVFASLKDLWSFVSGSIIYIAVALPFGILPFYFLFRRQIRTPLPDIAWWQATLMVVVLSLLGIIAIRGGLQGRPLNVTHAFVTGDYFLGNVTLNPVFALLKLVAAGDSLPVNRALGDAPLVEIQQMVGGEKEKFLDAAYPFYRELNPTQPQLKKNVVIFIMESWSAKDMGAFGNANRATPNFDRVAAGGLLFTDAYALGSRSITAVPTIVSSIASMFGRAYTTSSFATNRQRGMGTIFSAQGYETIFLAGYKAGAQGFSTYMKVAGFEQIYTREKFGLTSDKSDGIWGIYDEYTFEELHKVLAKAQKPFIAVVPSLHPHHPYKLPENYAEKKYYKNIDRTDHYNALRYSDYALGKFFALAEKSPYYKNTVFIITADHTYTQEGVLNKFHVPILFYSPGFLKPAQDGRIASQLDILPSVLDLLNVHTTHSGMGKSLFTKKPLNWAMLDIDSSAGYLEPPFALIANREKPAAVYAMSDAEFAHDLLREPGGEARFAPLIRRWYSYMNRVSDAIGDNRIAP